MNELNRAILINACCYLSCKSVSTKFCYMSYACNGLQHMSHVCIAGCLATGALQHEIDRLSSSNFLEY